jgi:hypothetical protein
MAQGLDGDWQVHRAGGFLPPLIGVCKQIEGGRGSTSVGPLPGVAPEVYSFEDKPLEQQIHRWLENEPGRYDDPPLA